MNQPDDKYQNHSGTVYAPITYISTINPYPLMKVEQLKSKEAEVSTDHSKFSVGFPHPLLFSVCPV